MTNFYQKIGQKIKSLREEKGWSQALLAQKMKLNQVSMSQIESGKRMIGAEELQKLAVIFGLSVDELMHLETKKSLGKEREDINQGIVFDKEKFQTVLLYLLEKCGGKPNVGETVIYKLLYFIDFDAYEKYGQSVTGMHYLKQQFGPVPVMKEFRLAVEQMKSKEVIKIFAQDYFGMKQKRYIALQKADLAKLNAQEIELINDVIDRLSDLSARQIEDYVHLDQPWVVGKHNREIDYNLVFDRQVPYAQRDHEQDWQDAGARDILKELGDMSDEEYKYYQEL